MPDLSANMTIKSSVKLTPELLITAPRRSEASPSFDGKYALYTVSTYSLDSHTETNEIKIIDLETEAITLFSDDPLNVSPQWLVDNQIVWLRKPEGKKTEIWIGTITGDKNAYLAGTIDSNISNFKSKILSDGTIAVAFSALINLDGTLFDKAGAQEPLSSAREYETISVRSWDKYVEREQSTLFYTILEKNESTLKYRLSITDPEVDLSETVSPTGLWYVEVDKFTAPPTKITKITIPEFSGRFSSPIFSPDGTSAAFLSTKLAQELLDGNRIFIIDSLQHLSHITQITPTIDHSKDHIWDINPDSLLWSNDGKNLYFKAEELAHTKLWKISLSLEKAYVSKPVTSVKVVPELITGRDRSVNSVHTLGENAKERRLFINTSSLIDNGSFYLADPETRSDTSFSIFALNYLALGLHKSQISEIYFRGEDDYEVQAWVVKPSDFDPKKSYPLAFLIHGGPSSAWQNTWSTRWNPAVWAEQGYVVVMPNPSGSTSFGKEFLEAVVGEWGGRPYRDIVKCFEYVEETMPFVNSDRAILAGGSYGGYMANWIAGQPLGLRFKTLISHDGVFSPYGMLASDMPQALKGEFGGDPWDSKSALEAWDRYNPSLFTKNWKTPMLIIHSDQDFRCPITEGLSAYHVCRMKGIPSRFLNFPDENHFVLKRENSLKWYKTVLGWANKYTGVDGVKLKPPVSERYSKRVT